MSCNDIVISANSLCKTYRTYRHPLDRFFRTRVRQSKEFPALRNVSFEIKSGEIVGIIGRNGSGKSTLLQLICGIRKPTSGSLKVNGRISALLELGAGFHPEFTGRENVFLQGSIMGFSRLEIESRFKDITTFAGIGDFIDQPVKTYSSGMFVRLAFAVAVNMEPSILIIDEALAVGDLKFQSMCFHRINEIRNGGGTILFVTHSTDQVVKICDRTMLLEDGEALIFDTPKLVVGLFQKLIYAPAEKRDLIRLRIKAVSDSNEQVLPAMKDSKENQHGNGEAENIISDSPEYYDPTMIPESSIKYESRGAEISSTILKNQDDCRVNNIISGETYRFDYTVLFEKEATNVRFGMLIKSRTGVEIGGASTATNIIDSVPVVHGGARIAVSFKFKCILNPGVYFLNAGVTGEIDGNEVILHRILDAEIIKVRSIISSTATGTVDLGCIAEINIINH